MKFVQSFLIVTMLTAAAINISFSAAGNYRLLGQLSLASLRGRLIEYQLRRGKGGNVTSAGWQVILCDPMWHVSSRSGVATLRTAIHLLLTYK